MVIYFLRNLRPYIFLTKPNNSHTKKYEKQTNLSCLTHCVLHFLLAFFIQIFLNRKSLVNIMNFFSDSDSWTEVDSFQGS